MHLHYSCILNIHLYRSCISACCEVVLEDLLKFCDVISCKLISIYYNCFLLFNDLKLKRYNFHKCPIKSQNKKKPQDFQTKNRFSNEFHDGGLI